MDVACYNDQHRDGPKAFSPIFLVECKDWSNPVGTAQVDYFLSRLQHRGLDFGVLIAANGVSGEVATMTAAHSTIAIALSKGVREIVITRTEIESLNSIGEFVRLMKRKICELVVRWVVSP